MEEKLKSFSRTRKTLDQILVRKIQLFCLEKTEEYDHLTFLGFTCRRSSTTFLPGPRQLTARVFFIYIVIKLD